jgi:glycosyltransferase involved in cell wall biosynthesis
LKNLKAAGLTVVFEVVGSSSFDESLKKITYKLKIEDRVIFHGWQEPEKLPEFIVRSHIGISPIKRNIHHDTTYANKIFQYMVYGKALLVSDCPPQSKVVKKSKGGVVFEANNPEDCAEKLKYLIQNREMLKVMGQNNIDAVQKYYNWDLNSNELIELYQKI